MTSESATAPQPASGAGGLLRGRVALVTGAVGSIGRSIAMTFAEHGARVAIADLDEDASRAVAAEVAAATGARTLGIGIDVTSLDSLERAADLIESDLGTCDTIVVNAGLLLAKPAVEISAGEWNAVQSVNLSGAFHTASVFARRMLASGRGGTITFSSSLFGTRGGAGNSAYSASKFGVIGVAQSMAAELAPAGIRVNSVCPGQIASAMLDDLFAKRAAASGLSVAEERAAFEKRIPLGRLGTTRDVADTFVYLASGLSSYVTGQHIIVDGGWQVG